LTAAISTLGFDDNLKNWATKHAMNLIIPAIEKAESVVLSKLQDGDDTNNDDSSDFYGRRLSGKDEYWYDNLNSRLLDDDSAFTLI
jgi:hypothetical protein